MSSEILAEIRDARLLVVDDEEMVCRLFEAMFPDQVTSAADADEALDALEEDDFDLVITDVRLPRVDGITLLEQIRQYWPELPIMIMTGYGRNVTVDQALQRGAADYINKPFRQGEVVERVATVLRQARLRSKLARYEACLEQIASRLNAQADDAEGLLREIQSLVQVCWPGEPAERSSDEKPIPTGAA